MLHATGTEWQSPTNTYPEATPYDTKVNADGSHDHEVPRPESSDDRAGQGPEHDGLGSASSSASAGELDSYIKALQASGNEIQLAFIEALRTMHEGRAYRELGCSSFGQYCRLELGLSRSLAYEYLKTAQALVGLHVVSSMFRDGDLSWEHVKAIARVATAKTEVKWIQLALKSSVRELQIEVRAAVREGREAPRENPFGLPNVMTRLMIDLTLEEKERVLVALTRAVQVLGGPESDPSSGGDIKANQADSANDSNSEGPNQTDGSEEDQSTSVDARTAMNMLADAILAGRFQVSRKDDPHANALPAAAVVYSGCRDCNRAKAETRYGAVEIDWELLEARAEEAELVDIPEEAEFETRTLEPGEIDVPNSGLLAKRVRYRDGLRCTSPGCNNRLHLQAHHMDFRANGGPTSMNNETSICPPCHALSHATLLAVNGDATTGELTWIRQPKSLKVRLKDIEALCRKAAALADAEEDPIERPVATRDDVAEPATNERGNSRPAQPSAETGNWSKVRESRRRTVKAPSRVNRSPDGGRTGQRAVSDTGFQTADAPGSGRRPPGARRRTNRRPDRGQADVQTREQSGVQTADNSESRLPTNRRPDRGHRAVPTADKPASRPRKNRRPDIGQRTVQTAEKPQSRPQTSRSPDGGQIGAQGR